MASLIGLAVLAAVLGLGLWYGDKRGWLNLRGPSGASSGPGVFFQIQKLLEPSSAHVERYRQEGTLKREDKSGED